VLRLGISECPNDCAVFHALLFEPRLTDLAFEVEFADVEALNAMAEAEALDVAKVSYHAAAHLLPRWALLRSGGALGRGVGPLVVTREALPDLAGRLVAIPGARTTAALLLHLAAPAARTEVLRYDRIMPAVAAGEVDAGLIIHESRFTYGRLGLRLHVDLGAWWEQHTGALIPLGAIAVRRDLPLDVQLEVCRAVRASVEAFFADPRASAAFVAEHAQELEPAVRDEHIALYVNRHTLDVGEAGERAVARLLAEARRVAGLEADALPPFVAAHAASRA
jgi:1,4-dihydroxy-6-naphthoate synthase